MILDGVQGCCRDLSCTEFEYESETATSTVPSVTTTPISITPISITPISFTPISFTRTHYSYFYFTWTFYYYTYFWTTIPPSFTTSTSTEVTSRTTLSVYATDTADANSQFESITAAATVPTAVTASGFASEGAALTSTSRPTSTLRPTSTSTPTTASTAGEGGANASTPPSGVVAAVLNAGEKRVSSFGMLLLGWLVVLLSL